MAEIRYLTRDYGKGDLTDISFYETCSGYRGLRKALLEMTPDQVIEEIKRSGLRGRGGAGFPAGVKWGFIPKDAQETYLCCNADEGEPGTFKDKYIMDNSPHSVVEGTIIASYAIKARQAFIFVRGEFAEEIRLLRRVLQQARDKNYVGPKILGTDYSLEVVVHPSAGSYIVGEETALLEALEGKRGYPKLKPPFPAQAGLYEKPTVINNVETLAAVPTIIHEGADGYASLGTEKSKGTKLVSVCGSVLKPGVYEIELGTPVRQIVFNLAGGPAKGRRVKAICPGGSSTPYITEEHLDAPYDYEGMAAVGTFLGSGGMIVLDDSICIVDATLNLIGFYHHESCGKCTPCREGCGWIEKIIRRIEKGEGKQKDLDLLLDLCENMAFKCFCPLGDAAIAPIQSSIKYFRDEYLEHITNAGCPLRKEYARF